MIFLFFYYPFKLFNFTNVCLLLIFLDINFFCKLFQFLSCFARNFLNKANTLFLFFNDWTIFGNLIKISKTLLKFFFGNLKFFDFAEIVPVLLFEFLHLAGIHVFDYLVEARRILTKLLFVFVMVSRPRILFYWLILRNWCGS